MSSSEKYAGIRSYEELFSLSFATLKRLFQPKPPLSSENIAPTSVLSEDSLWSKKVTE